MRIRAVALALAALLALGATFRGASQNVTPQPAHLLGIVPASADSEVTLAFLTAGPAAMRAAGVEVHHFYRQIDELDDAAALMTLLGSPVVISITLFEGSSVATLPNTAACAAFGWTNATCMSDIASAYAVFASTYRPFAIVIGTEIETFFALNPGLADEFVTLAELIKGAVEDAAPRTLVGIGIGYDPADEALYATLWSDELDFIGLNVYGADETFENDDPLDGITKLDEAYDFATVTLGTVLAVPELGMSSATTLNSSETDQETWADGARDWWDDPAHADVLFATAFLAFDCQPDFTAGEPCYQRAAALAEGTPDERIFDHIANLGLIRNDGTAKPAYEALFGANVTALERVQCDDDLDNDGDGLTDLLDPGCVDASDDDESGGVEFAVTKIQGTTCIAPCAVHVDATATADPTLTREFHSMAFEWDFDDPTSGTWATTGAPKDSDFGAISGHVYETAGTYTITLTARRPDGEVFGTTTEDVTVTAASTIAEVCLAVGVTPTAGVAGCPATADAVVRRSDGDLDVALAAIGFSTQRVIYLRAASPAEAWTVSTATTLGAGSMIGTYASGDRPVVTASSDVFVPIDGATVSGFDLECSSDCRLFQGHDTAGLNGDGITVHDMVLGGKVADGFNGGSVTKRNTRISWTDVALVKDSTTTATTYCSFGPVTTLLWLGNTCDLGYLGAGDNAQYGMRHNGLVRGVVAHSLWKGFGGTAGGARNAIAIRTGEDSVYPTQYVEVRDNVIELSDTADFIRTCNAAGCDGTAGNPLTDVVIERNFFYVRSGLTGASICNQSINLQGKDITVRNNVIDGQGCANAGNVNVVVHGDGASADQGALDTIHVLGNTFYGGASPSGSITFCGTENGASGMECRGNLAVRDSGSITMAGAGWTASGNVGTTGMPFDATPGAQATTDAGAFVLDSADTIAKGQGYDASARTDTSLLLDYSTNCRPASTTWDAGALEEGASPCP